MNHPHEDQLLLLAYGEEQNQDVERHVATCVTCQQALERFERGRVALEMTFPKRPGRARWLATGLAAAAILAAVLFTRGGSHGMEPWQPSHVWSPTAGYVAGGVPVLEIDAQLTRLEQERTYVRP